MSDARNRAWRTWLQGLVVAVAVAVFTVVQAAVAGGDLFAVHWGTVGQAVVNAAGIAVVSFIWRRFLDGYDCRPRSRRHTDERRTRRCRPGNADCCRGGTLSCMSVNDQVGLRFVHDTSGVVYAACGLGCAARWGFLVRAKRAEFTMKADPLVVYGSCVFCSVCGLWVAAPAECVLHSDGCPREDLSGTIPVSIATRLLLRSTGRRALPEVALDRLVARATVDATVWPPPCAAWAEQVAATAADWDTAAPA